MIIASFLPLHIALIAAEVSSSDIRIDSLSFGVPEYFILVTDDGRASFWYHAWIAAKCYIAQQLLSQNVVSSAACLGHYRLNTRNTFSASQ